MTPEQAIDRLLWHTHPESGAFLEMLRPYRGTLDVDVLRDVESAVRAALPVLSESEVPRRLVSALWTIVHYGRMWALDPDGMLRRNNLINDQDRETLESFMSCLSLAVALVFDGAIDAGLNELGSWRNKH